MRIHRKKHPIIQSSYHPGCNLGGDILHAVSSQSYLGVDIHEQLSW